MAKRNTKSKKSENGIANDDEFVTVSVKFAPIWKPQSKGEVFIGIPVGDIHKIEIKKGKGKPEQSYVQNFELVKTNTDNFYKKDEQVEVEEGQEVAIGLGATLCANNPQFLESKLALQEDRDDAPTDSPLLVYCKENRENLRLHFTGTEKSRNYPTPMKMFEIGVPKHVLDAIAK